MWYIVYIVLSWIFKYFDTFLMNYNWLIIHSYYWNNNLKVSVPNISCFLLSNPLYRCTIYPIILSMKNFTGSQNLRKIAWVLLIVGWLNRGLLWLFNFDIVAWIFGFWFFGRVVYTLVGISTVFVLLYPNVKVHTPLRK